MKKKILNTGLWLVFATGVLFLMSFVSRKQNGLVVSSDTLVIDIQHDNENAFITGDIVKERVAAKLGYELDSVDLNEIDLTELEYCVIDMDEVHSAEVYRSIDGELTIELKERVPIIRVLHSNGMSNYIDEEGHYMGLSSVYSAHIPIVTGHFNESSFRESIHSVNRDSMLFDDIYDLGTFLYYNEFWQAQIQEVYLNEEGEFELIPRIGDHRIIFGSLENMERKFKKLKIFYEEGLNNTGWNQFDTINVKFKNQIVCS